MTVIRRRSSSHLTVVLVLLIILLLQVGISYGTMFGKLDQFIPAYRFQPVAATWITFRSALWLLIMILWFMDKKRPLFRLIIVFNAVMTFGLVINMSALGDVLLNISPKAIQALLAGVVLMVIANILIFSIWYWIIDPPGVEDNPRGDRPWDFLFPQRAELLPNYELWAPRYSDYLYLAFTASFAFSPTDTLPLTRRSKMLMLLQSTISIITLTAIAGGAINILAGSR